MIQNDSEGPIVTASGDSVTITITVVPRASRAAVMLTPEGRVRVSVTSPPVDGAANRAVIDVIARHFSVKRSVVSIVMGQRGRRKAIRIQGMTLEHCLSMLRSH